MGLELELFDCLGVAPAFLPKREYRELEDVQDLFFCHLKQVLIEASLVYFLRNPFQSF